MILRLRRLVKPSNDKKRLNFPENWLIYLGMHVKTLLLKTSQKEGRISDKRNVSSSRLHSDFFEELSSEANELERLVFWVRTTVYSPDMFQSLKACTALYS